MGESKKQSVEREQASKKAREWEKERPSDQPDRLSEQQEQEGKTEKDREQERRHTQSDKDRNREN